MRISSVIVALGAFFVQQCLCLSALADAPLPNPAPWVNFSGQWSTETNSGRKLTMDLTQFGNRVAGKYDFSDLDLVKGARVNGVLSGTILPDGKLAFVWTQNGNPQAAGNGVLSPAEDMSTFLGTYSCTIPPGAPGGTWNGKKVTGVGAIPPGGTKYFNEGALTQPPQAQVFPVMAATGRPELDTAIVANENIARMNRSFDGNWGVQIHGGTYITISFTQKGSIVTGKYAPYNGKIEGNLERDGRLVYRWSDERGSGGAGIFAIYNGNWLVGTFGTSQNSTEVVGCWAGKRGSAYTPPPPPPAPLAAQVFPSYPPGLIYQNEILKNERLKQLNRVYVGKWVVKDKSSGTEFTMNFSQNGNSVTGTFQPKNGKIDGIMGADGRLSYRWSDESGTSGAGVFVIYNGVQLIGTYSTSKDSSAVSGQWAGARQ